MSAVIRLSVRYWYTSYACLIDGNYASFNYRLNCSGTFCTHF